MRSIAILQQMDIPVWQLKAPQRINAQPNIAIPQHCRLLFIAPQCPEQGDIELMEKIVQSMGVQLSSVYYLSAEQLRLINQPQKVEWIWFCGEDICRHSLNASREIHSHPLASLQHNPLFKKQLWQQIKEVKEV